MYDLKAFTFEQLCIRKETGFSFDNSSMYMASNPACFDDVVFKIISKIDTSLLLLDTHGEVIESFTVIAIPLPNEWKQSSDNHGRNKALTKNSNVNALDALQDAWQYLSYMGWNGLQCLAVIGKDSIPNNGAREYSVYKYITCILDVIRANYMFQKFRSNFENETLDMFREQEMESASWSTFGLLWKRKKLSPHVNQAITEKVQKRKSVKNVADSSPPKKAKGSSSTKFEAVAKRFAVENDDQLMEIDEEVSIKGNTSRVNGHSPVPSKLSPPKPASRRGRKNNVQPEVEKVPSDGDSYPMNSTVALETRRGRKKKVEPEEVEMPSEEVSYPMDTTIALETSEKTAPKSGRKSMAGRKSLSSEWPEDERQEILAFFDNLNPNVSEQKRIALTCKYVAIQMDKDLPSKLLYQWVQKKGRPIERSKSAFDIPEDKHKEVAVSFFNELDSGKNTEAARANFCLKYIETQHGVKITSKQLFVWVNEKPANKRMGKRR